MNHPYFYSCFIPFHLADPAGIVFFGHAFTLFHQAFEQFIVEQLKCPWHLWFQNPEWIVPIKQAESNYLAPLYAGESCQVEIKVSAYRTSSFVLVSSIQQTQLCCSLKTVHVFCERSTQKKRAMPAAFASYFQMSEN